ncbi:hypothetical protein PYW08_001519 [Mythimna loreyi]|uniref:Uncharacterized protein n=1 Tax=Mythimna loreyi TaxID=667449 RepID=A0ACC2R484_9NEOP|nr:hypothetical protein PYW08_001519 [Mythimna loreyi]
MYKTPPKTPPNQYSSRSESDIRKLHSDQDPVGNITQRAKRRCLSDEVSGGDLDIFKNDIKKMINEMICSQSSRLDKLEGHIKEIKNHYTEIKATNTDLERAMTVVSDQLQSLENKITGLENQRGSMAIQLAKLENRLEVLDHNLIKTSIELRNVPKRQNETKIMLYDTISHLSRHLGLDTESSSIRDVTRLPSKKENVTSSLTVEFCNTLVKTKFLAAVKDYNKLNPTDKIKSTHLNLKSLPETPIYITELLTANTKRLFYLSRNHAKTHQYKYCWTSNGKVMLKKNPDSQTIVVRSEEQLKQLAAITNA